MSLVSVHAAKSQSCSEDRTGKPRLHRWTPEEYIQASAAGLFGSRRTELIDGEIYDVSSQNNPHVAAISNLTRLLVAAFDESYWLTIQSTIRLPLGDMPDPDFAVRPGPATSDNSVHPLPLLVIEVSDETLLHDQTIKAGMYAANGVADYWIANVNDRQVEVYRDPVPDATRRHGARYSSFHVFRAPSYVVPLAKPDVRIDVAKIF